jgi:hypothetical protein
MMRILLFLFLALLHCVCLYAQAPKYSNEFLSIGVGARALGMSGAQVAAAEDVTSGYWNPAGLTGVTGNVQLAAMHSEYFAGIASYDYGAVAMPIDATSVVSFSVIRFGVDNIPDTSQLIDASGNVDYDRIRSFSVADYGFLFGYARKLKPEGLSVGGSAKVVHRVIGGFASAWGFGIDAGIKYKKNGLIMGCMARDMSGTFNAWSFNLSDELKDVFTRTNNAIPDNTLEVTLPRIIPAIAYERLMGKKFSVFGEVDLEMTFDGKRNVLIGTNAVSIDPRMGLEVGYDRFVFLRAGIGNIQRVKNLDGNDEMTFQPNLGIGIRLKKLAIDYAIANPGGGNDLPFYHHVFSLRLDIVKRKQQ